MGLPRKRPVRMQTYSIISDAVERGLAFGLRRLFKHDSAPKTEAQVLEQLERVQHEVMLALDEVIDWQDEG